MSRAPSVDRYLPSVDVVIAGESDRIGAVFVLRSDGAALLQHRDDKPGLRNGGKWVPPGGHADAGEPMIECARRELREETDYDASDLHLLESFVDRVDGWPPYELTIFWCSYDGIQTVVCREGQALAFIPRSNAQDYPIPANLINTWDAALSAARVRNEHSSR